MPVKTILCLMPNPEQGRAPLRTARQLAEMHNAHLVGLHVIESLVVYPGVAAAATPEIMNAFGEMERAEAQAVKEMFDGEMEHSGLAFEWRAPKRGADAVGARVLESARTADLVVVPQPHEDYDQRLTSTIVRDTGRPVLVVPKEHKGETIGASFLVGWSATREATRAAFDTLTIANQGAEGFLLTVSRGPTPDAEISASARDLAATLNRHGLSITVVYRPAEGADVADVLMQEAFERGVDVIVSGAFGHSLAYDFILGAVTYDLMRKSTLPVLFSK